MATVKIKRINDYINSLRDYRLFIDGQKIGTIGNNQIKDFDIPSINLDFAKTHVNPDIDGNSLYHRAFGNKHIFE